MCFSLPERSSNIKQDFAMPISWPTLSCHRASSPSPPRILSRRVFRAKERPNGLGGSKYPNPGKTSPRPSYGRLRFPCLPLQKIAPTGEGAGRAPSEGAEPGWSIKLRRRQKPQGRGPDRSRERAVLPACPPLPPRPPSFRWPKKGTTGAKVGRWQSKAGLPLPQRTARSHGNPKRAIFLRQILRG
jgi:hypothetical protein